MQLRSLFIGMPKVPRGLHLLAAAAALRGKTFGVAWTTDAPCIVENPSPDDTTVLRRFDTRVQASTFYLALGKDDPSKTVELVFTDGACTYNGNADRSRGGVGVFWGTDDPRNIGVALQGEEQTNNRAELVALLYALRGVEAAMRGTAISLAIPGDDEDGVVAALPSGHGTEYRILSDSRYSIDCVQSWYDGWRARNWRTSAGTPVRHKAVIVAIKRLLTAVQAATSVKLLFVKGHDGVHGNVQADALARAGAALHE